MLLSLNSVLPLPVMTCSGSSKHCVVMPATRMACTGLLILKGSRDHQRYKYDAASNTPKSRTIEHELGQRILGGPVPCS